MLKIYKNNQLEALKSYSDFNLTHNYTGDITLSFNIQPNSDDYIAIKEENRVLYSDNYYKIKQINQRSSLSSVVCLLDMDEWKDTFHHTFQTAYDLFADVLTMIIPVGWHIEGAGSVTERRAMNLTGVTNYDILMHCKDLYNIVFEYHTKEKLIKVIKPDTIQSRGLYLSDELNLRELIHKGDSNSLVTRLYVYGKKVEEFDIEGNVINTTYLTIESVNDGKNYIDNNEYSDNVIIGYWQDDRYENPQELKDDAIEKLAELSKPVRAYECSIVDLSRINDKYKILDFKMYDKITLIDNISNIKVQHQVVEYVEYPDNPNLNKITLASTFKSITGTIDNVKQSISDIDIEIKRNESAVNEIIRDVLSNTLRINNTYTKGEVDVIEETLIQQSNDSIGLAVTNVQKDIQSVYASLELSIEGILSKLKTNGGNNLVRDSAGLFNDGSWTGTVTIDDSNEVKNINIYGAGLSVDGILKQDIRVINGQYTLSFYYRKNKELAETHVKINGNEVVLESDDFTFYEQQLSINDMSVSLEFFSDTIDGLTIVNLMLNPGLDPMNWDLNTNETYGDTIRIGKGIEVGSTTSPVKFVAKADHIGFIDNNEEFVSIFTDVGLETKEIIVEQNAMISNVLIQDINGQTTFNRIGGEK